MRELTKKQTMILVGMIRYTQQHHCLPTSIWINGLMGVQNSVPTLRTMEEKGYVESFDDGTGRGGRWKVLRHPSGKPIDLTYPDISEIDFREDDPFRQMSLNFGTFEDQ